MKKNKRSKARLQAGFTMMETLGVLALLAIVIAVAIPNIVQAQANMRMMQLDQQAEQVYNAVQYRLSALQSTGHLAGDDGLAESVANDAGAQKVSAAPADYTGTWDADRDLYALESNNLADAAGSTKDQVVTAFLATEEGTPITNALNSGHFIIELSPTTAEVYAVYYWEGDADVNGNKGAQIHYADVKGYRKDRVPRTPLRLGYYGGGEISRAVEPPKPPETIAPINFELVNGEELYIKVSGGASGSNSLGMDDYNPAKLKKLAFYVDGVEWSSTEDLSFTEKTGLDVDCVIDSVRADVDWRYNQLRNGNKNNNSLPAVGEDLTASVKASYEVDGSVQTIDVPLKNKPGIYEKTANSLYDRLVADDADNMTVYVSKVRHLENLRKARFIGEKYVNDNADVPFTQIYISDDIDFDGHNWKDTAVSKMTRAASTEQGWANGYNRLTTFAPLAVHNANFYWSSIRSEPFTKTETCKGVRGYFDSDEKKEPKKLKNFCIGAGSEKIVATASSDKDSSKEDAADLEANKGLVGTQESMGFFSQVTFPVTGVTFENVRLLAVKGSGAFAPWADGPAVFTDCHITGASRILGQNGSSEDHMTNVGGFVGALRGAGDITFTDCSVDGIIHADGGAAAGYVASTSENHDYSAVFSNCTCTANISAGMGYSGSLGGTNSYVGGFTGYMRRNSSYANCKAGTEDEPLRLSGNAGLLGGVLAYSEEDNTYANCTARVIADGKGANCGGIVGMTHHNKTSQWTRMTDCTVEKGSVIKAGKGTVGGLGGRVKGAAIRCRSHADVEAGANENGDSYAGGAFGMLCNGQNENTEITDCFVGDDATAPSITGSGNKVGGFIGTCAYTKFTNCGVHGATPDGLATVKGEGYVGGFAGVTGIMDGNGNRSMQDDTHPEFDRCWSAMSVAAHDPGSKEATCVGGFIGQAFHGPQFKRCYSSGSVQGYSHVGGFAGEFARTQSANLLSIEDCYTTSDVRGSDETGGFVGRIRYWDRGDDPRIKHCISYGQVKAGGAQTCGGFFGRHTRENDSGLLANNPDTLDWPVEKWADGCAYLQGDGYNDFSTGAEQPAALGYDDAVYFFSNYSLSAKQSHPYSSNLRGKAFPFGCIAYGSDHIGLDHYGNWPSKG